jgi:YD repeat-containing protein
MNKKIRSVTVTRHDYVIRNINEEEPDIREYPHLFTEYNLAGQPVKEVKYDRSGGFEEMLAFEYNDAGQLITESYFQAEDEVAEKKYFEWNDAGQVTASRKEYLDGSVDHTRYFYDEEGRLIRRVTTSEDEEEETEEFEYPEPGEEEAPAEEPSGDLRITRDEKGQVILEEEYGDTGDLLTRVGRTYSEDGRLLEVDAFIDGQGRAISRHYILKYDYEFYPE